MMLWSNKTDVVSKSVLILLVSLTGCASAPSVPKECPKIPELPVRVQTGESYQERMQDFLRGKLPEQRSSEPHLKPAIDSLMPSLPSNEMPAPDSEPLKFS